MYVCIFLFKKGYKRVLRTVVHQQIGKPRLNGQSSRNTTRTES